MYAWEKQIGGISYAPKPPVGLAFIEFTEFPKLPDGSVAPQDAWDIVGDALVVDTAKLTAWKEKEAARVIQAYLNAEVQSREYDDVNSLSKFLRPESQFYAECSALCVWIDACWGVAKDIRDGTIAEPADEAALIALLPSAPA